MFFSSDEERYRAEYENSNELQISISLEDYIYARQVKDYGLDEDDLDNYDDVDD